MQMIYKNHQAEQPPTQNTATVISSCALYSQLDANVR